MKSLLQNTLNTISTSMNTGVEGGETANKIARKWGYKLKE